MERQTAFVRLMASELLFLGEGQTFIFSLLDLAAAIDPGTLGQQFARGLEGFTLSVLSLVEQYFQISSFRSLWELLQGPILLVLFPLSNAVWNRKS